jgi:hypothetical protein
MKRLGLLGLGLIAALAHGAGAPGVYSGTITGTGSTAGPAVTIYGDGAGNLTLTGTLGGGYATIEQVMTDGTWLDISDGGYSGPLQGYRFDLGGCVVIRVKLNDAVSTPSFTWMIVPEFYKPPTNQSVDCNAMKPQ